MSSIEEKARDLLKGKGIMSTQELMKAGMTKTRLRNWKEKGVIEKVAPGLYQHIEDYFTSPHHDFAVVQKLQKNCHIIGPSAAAWHEIGTVLSEVIWIRGPAGSNNLTKSSENEIRVKWTKRKIPDDHIEEVFIENTRVKITNLERTVIDCLEMINDIGADMAMPILRDAIEDKKTNFSKLYNTAKEASSPKHVFTIMEAAAHG